MKRFSPILLVVLLLVLAGAVLARPIDQSGNPAAYPIAVTETAVPIPYPAPPNATPTETAVPANKPPKDSPTKTPPLPPLPVIGDAPVTAQAPNE